VGRPDALFLPASLKRGATLRERVGSVADVADGLLEVDASDGEKSYIRTQPHNVLFVTRDPYDSIYYPLDHPKSGQPRYRWEKRDGGVQIGYLIESVVSSQLSVAEDGQSGR
jgi:hypothetical protein